MEKKWDDERSLDDAPIWYYNIEAAAWAAGYNDAVDKFKEEQCPPEED